MNSSHTVRGIIFLAVCAVLALTIYVGFRLATRVPPTTNASVADNATVDLTAAASDLSNSTAPANPPAAAAPPADYAWATDMSRIDANPAFVKAKLGPPEMESDTSMTYTIGGCAVRYGVSNKAIQWIQTDVSAKCTPQVWDDRVTPSTTVRDIARNGGTVTLRADCIHLCGNAYNPSVELFVPAAHVSNFIEASFTLSDPDNVDPSQLWARQIAAKEGKTLEDADEMECATDPPPQLLNYVMGAKFSQVTYGRNIPIGNRSYQDCESVGADE